MLARLASAGHRVVLVLATDGGAGLAAAELRADGQLGGLRMHCSGCRIQCVVGRFAGLCMG